MKEFLLCTILISFLQSAWSDYGFICMRYGIRCYGLELMFDSGVVNKPALTASIPVDKKNKINY